MIPPYTARYPREKAAYQQLAGDYMCPLLATDDDCCALLLRRIAPGKYADFDDNICLTDFSIAWYARPKKRYAIRCFPLTA